VRYAQSSCAWIFLIKNVTACIIDSIKPFDKISQLAESRFFLCANLLESERSVFSVCAILPVL